MSKNPLISYCLIKGSAKAPYICIIDAKQNIIGHYCPDFKHRAHDHRSMTYLAGWCKHLGKLLILMQQQDSQIIHTSYKILKTLKVVRNKNQLESIVEGYKNETILLDDPKNFLLEDALRLFTKLVKHESSDLTYLSDKITQQLKNKLNEQSIYSQIELIYDTILQLKQHSVIFDQHSGNFLSLMLKANFNEFLNDFFRNNSIFRYEIAFLLHKTKKYLSFSVGKIKASSIPIKNKTQSEILDLLIIFKKLDIENDLSHEFGQIDFDKRISHAINKIKFQGSNLPDLMKWLSSIQADLSFFSYSYDKLDDFLIYCIKSNGEQIKYEVKIKRRDQFTYLPVKLQEENPAFKYAIEHIKESERNYLTGEEYYNHQRFFDWIKQTSVTTSWIELPRDRLSAVQIPNEGIIFQLDVNGSKFNDEFLQVYYNNKRVTIDPNSPVYNKLQPFDFVLCKLQMTKKRNWSQKAYGLHIVHAEQIYDLMIRGFKVVSDLLPFNLLENFLSKGHIEQGDVRTAINYCDQNSFIYGSHTLKQKLEELAKLGQVGLSKNRYEEIHTFIINDRGRVNTRTRPLLKEIILAEGQVLNYLLQSVEIIESRQLRFIFSCVKESKKLDIFRHNFIKKVVNKKSKDLDANFLDYLKSENLNLYHPIKTMMQNKLQLDLTNIKKKVNEKKHITRKSLRNNPFGKVILVELAIQGPGKIKDDEFEAIKIKLDKL